MSKTLNKSNIVMPTEAENRRIIAAAKSDSDAQPLTEKHLKAMVPMKSLRGRPKLEKKDMLI